MNTERLVSVAVAVVVVTALGVAASTFAASMATDPADAVSVQEDLLPIGEDSQGDVERVAQGIHDRYVEGRPGGSDDGGPSPGDGGAEAPDQADAGPRKAPDPAESKGGSAGGGTTGDTQASQRLDGATGAAGGAGPSQSGASGGGGPDGEGPGIDPDWPWLPLLLLALLAGLAYRYRQRLRELLGPEDGTDEPADPLRPDPENDVERAWVELLQRAGVPAVRTSTPRDCARAAIETGYDPSDVERLRRLFEDVQYGGTTPTAEQARRARETLARLDGETA